MRVLLVDDHAILIDGIKNILKQEVDLQIAGTASSGEQALNFLKTQTVDLVITDFNMPGIDGLTLIKTIKQLQPETKFIILSMHDEVHLVREIIKAGVHGYVLKKDTQSELLNAVAAIRNGNIYLSNNVNKLLVYSLDEPDEGRLLTDREREILKYITQEFTTRQIAEELFISERTVETHRKNIFKKTGVASLVGLVKFAYANNLV